MRDDNEEFPSRLVDNRLNFGLNGILSLSPLSGFASGVGGSVMLASLSSGSNPVFSPLPSSITVMRRPGSLE